MMAVSNRGRAEVVRGQGEFEWTLVGVDACWVDLRARMEAIRNRACIVLICGESGTGKELIARSIHCRSQRATGPFIPMDCTTLRDSLVESQLFGHEKGAFTGAAQSTLGLFRAADGGTLFIDEIGELRLDMQAKLLRSIQERAVVPLGGVEPIPIDVRIIAATHRDLGELVRQGSFREDLYYRLNVIRLELPALRDRRDDIIPLAEHFVRQHAAAAGEPNKPLSGASKAVLKGCPWPGNVRELRNAMEHACIFATGQELEVADLPEPMRGRRSASGSNGSGGNGYSQIIPLKEAERRLVRLALIETEGNQTRAAELLDIERHRLARLVRRHGLQTLAKSRGS